MRNKDFFPVFVAFIEDNASHYEFNTVFRKSCIVFCAKPKEVDPIKLISHYDKKSVSITLKYIINNSVLKQTESGHR